MSDAEKRAGLLAAISADPESDGPRLVFADYLGEQGDPRGEFINVQVRLAKRVNPSRRRELLAREAELLKAHRSDWVASEGTRLKVTLRRGFVHSISGSASELAGAPSLLATQTVRIVKVRGGTGSDLDAFVAAGLIGRLRSFGFSQASEPDSVGEAIARLASSDQFASLRYLNLSAAGIGDEELQTLVESPHFKLRSLALNGGEIGKDGIEALASAAACKSLEELYLARNQIDNDSLALIVQSSQLSGVRLLGLSGNEDINDAGLECLNSPAVAQRFERLELGQIGFDDPPDLDALWGGCLDLEW